MELCSFRGGRREGTSPSTWASEAKERMVEVAAPEPQGPLEGSWYLGSYMKLVSSREGVCGQGTSRGGA